MSVRLRLSLVLGLLIVMLLGLVYVSANAFSILVSDTSELNRIGDMRSLATRIEYLTQEVVDQDSQTSKVENALADELSYIGLLSASLRQFFGATENVSRAAFDTFVDDLRREYPAMRTAQYAPRITAFARGQFEAGLQGEGFNGFRIKQLDLSGQLITAGQSTEYFPINYIAPIRDNEGIFGYDLASTPDVLAALNQARDTATTVATAPTTLGPDRDLSVLLVTPIYRNGVDISSIDGRLAALTGYVVVEVDLGRIITETAVISGPENQIVSIDDVTNAEATLPIASFEVADDSATNAFPLAVFGRQWNVIMTIETALSELTGEISTTMTEIQTRVAGLQSGPDGGISRHSTPLVIPAYNEIADLTNGLASDINQFIAPTTTADLRDSTLR